LQVASTKLNADLAHSLRTIRLSGVTYNLYTWSLPQLGQVPFNFFWWLKSVTYILNLNVLDDAY